MKSRTRKLKKELRVTNQKLKSMGLIQFGNAIVLGNFNKLTKHKPKDWIHTGYKITVPYKFKWRDRIGKVECDCKECEEHYMPYYGIDWYHSKDCALMKLIEKRPQILNLWQFQRDMRLIASTD